MQKIVIIYGPPGSGKGTQANLLFIRKDFIHFDTGEYIENVVHDPANKNDKVIQREKKNFDTGMLCTPSWVIKEVRNKTEQLIKSGFPIVFSGSPRTVFESMGDDKNEGLYSFFDKVVGKENVYVFLLKVPPEVSIYRNSNRLLCTVCGLGVMAGSSSGERCHFCGGKLYRRTLDNVETIKVRLKQFEDRTKPILKEIKKVGYKVHEIDGKPQPYKVHEKIVKILKI